VPIISIPQQPTSNSLHAAYRPVVLRCTAQHSLPLSPTAFVPPVVYCDIYFNNVFYKTLTKTQPINKPDFATGIPALYEFDIQDAAQEYLRTELAPNGASNIYETTTEMLNAYCKCRSSGYNTNGFIIAEDTAPIQGTGAKPPVAGTGTQSNTFFMLNMRLQHEHHQDLTTHLGYVKSNTNGAWSTTDAYPASHRPKTYYVGLNDSDYYPFVYKGNADIKCMKLYYKTKNKTIYQTDTYCRCTGRIIGTFKLPNAIATKPYLYEINATINAPLTVNIITKPTWMMITATATKISFSGTPARADISATPVPVNITIINCSGTNSIPLSDTVLVVKPCEGSIIGTPKLPTAYAGKPYVYILNLSIDLPFSITTPTPPLPPWLGITIGPTTIAFTGTPTIADISATPVKVALEIINCGGTNRIKFSDSFSVQGAPSLTIISDTRTGSIFFPRRRQVFRVGSYVYAGYTYKLKPSFAPGNDAIVVAVAGDTPITIAQKIVNAISAKSYSTTIYTLLSSGTDLTVEIRYPYRFEAETFY